MERINKPYQPNRNIELSANTFSIIDLGTNLTGFIGAYIRCLDPTKLYLTFDEILSKDDVDFKRLSCVNTVCYDLQPGTYHLESFEPYTMRYLKLNVLQGICEIQNLYLREYANSETEEAKFSCNDPRLNRIFEAARQTFRQNAIDIFMDCPSRERAGHVVHSLYRDILGVHVVDTQKKVIRLRIADVGLDWCEGRLLTPQGPVVVKWWKDNNETRYRAEAPAGYVLEVEDLTGNGLSSTFAILILSDCISPCGTDTYG